MRVRFVVVAVLVAALAVIGFLLLPGANPEPLEPAPAGPTVRRTSLPLPPTPDIPAPDPEAEPGPDSAASAHAAIAEALGLVSMRCHVGPGYDQHTLMGAYHPRIRDGWYSDAAEQLEGMRQVEARFQTEGKADDHEDLFWVSWKAEAPGQAVPCTVHWLRYARIVARIVDPAGQPLPGVSVAGCGYGVTDARGTITLDEVLIDRPCALSASHIDSSRMAAFVGSVDVPALAEHATHEVTLRLEERPLAEVLGALVDFEMSAFSPERYREQLTTFEALRKDASGEGAALLDALIAHRQRLVAMPASKPIELTHEDLDALDEAFDALKASGIEFPPRSP